MLIELHSVNTMKIQRQLNVISNVLPNSGPKAGANRVIAFILANIGIACKIVVKYAHNHYQLFIHIGQACLFIGALSACIVSWFLADSLLSTILCIMLITFGFGLSLPILSRLTLETSHVAMGVRVTIFSVIRVSSGCIGSLAITLF